MINSERISLIRRMANEGDTPLDIVDVVRFLLAQIDFLQSQLLSQSVCDCHTWPTLQEMHDYVIALEVKIEKNERA